MKKYLTIVALLTVIATPAFAQSFIPSYGTGNALPFAYGSTAQAAQSVARENGNDAFAMAPGGNGTLDPYSPTVNGGGSEGYNWSVAHDY